MPDIDNACQVLYDVQTQEESDILWRVCIGLRHQSWQNQKYISLFLTRLLEVSLTSQCFPTRTEIFPQGNINGIIKLSWLQRWQKLLKWREFFLGFVWWTESGVSKHSDLRFYMRHARKMGFGADFHWCRKDMNWRLAPLTCTCPKARLCKLWAEPKLSELDMLIMFLCQEVAHLSPWGATTHSIHCNLDELEKFPPSQKNNCEASGIALGIGSNC